VAVSAGCNDLVDAASVVLEVLLCGDIEAEFKADLFVDAK
jgi:hypothetical protein